MLIFWFFCNGVQGPPKPSPTEALTSTVLIPIMSLVLFQGERVHFSCLNPFPWCSEPYSLWLPWGFYSLSYIDYRVNLSLVPGGYSLRRLKMLRYLALKQNLWIRYSSHELYRTQYFCLHSTYILLSLFYFTL